MRPIRLAMSAFGPYAHEQVIDFRQLGRHSFFLIHGPTGGGKTTILDAMCYALYGDTSGDERTGEQMRSQLAPAKIPTWVVFDFAVGDKHYRVRRSPAQQRPSKRGDDMVDVPPKAMLWDRTGLTDDGDDGNPIADRTTRVTEEVQQRLGVRSEQFRQVILLPQGKFRELLTADSARREDILRTLFQTEFYGHIQDALKEKAKRVEQRAHDARLRQEGLLQQAQASSASDLQTRHATTQQAITALLPEIERLRQVADDAQSRLTDATQIKGRLDERDTAATALHQVEANRNEVEGTRRSLDAGRRATTLAPVEAALTMLQRDAERRREELTKAQRKLSTTETAQATAAQALRLAEQRASEMPRWREDLARYTAMRQRVQAIEQTARDLQTAEARLKIAAAQLDAAQLGATRTREQLEKRKSELAEAQRLAATDDGNRLALDQAVKQQRQRADLDAARQLATRQTRQSQATQARITAAKQDILQAKAALSDLQRAWIDAQAAVLAQKLADGEPCPVCGSLEHPVPATSHGELPSEQQIKERQADVDRQEQALAVLQHEAQSLAAAVATTEATAKGLAESLGAAAEIPLAEVAARVDSARKAADTSTAAQAAVAHIQKQVSDLTGKVEAAGKQVEQLRQDDQTANDEVTRLRALREGQSKDVPENLRAESALEQEIARLTQQINQIETDTQSARSNAADADKLLAAAREATEKAMAEASHATDALTVGQRDFEAKRQQAGFASDSEYRAARLAEVQLRGLEEQIASYERTLSAANDRLRRAEEAAQGLAMPDLNGLRAALAAAKGALEAAIGRRAGLDRDLTLLGRILAELAAAMMEQEKAEAEYAVVGELAKVARGENSAGLTFERFVLTSFLDDVLIAASERLKIMSRGRYHLQRCLERADLRVRGGLDLEVYDTYSGMARPVATLSGGESFLAALALALGLADVVQSYAGGIRLDTMFIDEGFGSLDSEALDLAVRSLTDLLKEGRLVGIISHVPELRERFAARLEITAGREGSAATFSVSGPP